YSTGLQTGSAEGIWANVNITQNTEYVLSYFIRKATFGAASVNNFYIKLVKTSDGGFTPNNNSTILTPTTQQVIAHNTNISHTNWIEYKVCFTADEDFDVVYIHPESNGGGGADQWIQFDEIQITPLTVNAGNDLAVSCTGSGTIGATSCTPIPGVTYSWSPTYGLTDPTAASTTVNPVYASTTYTLTASVDGTSCSITDEVLVTASSGSACSGSLVISTANGNTSYTGTNTISASTVAINNNVTIVSGTTTITSDDVRIFTNVRIVVSNGATLIIDGAWLHACNPCGGMWDGIHLDAGATLQIINSSVIEDAANAILTTSGTVPSYTIDKAIFNKNTIAIKIQANSNDMSANVIKNTIITCRQLPAPTAAADFDANFGTIKSALETNTTSSLLSYPTFKTLANVRSAKGIEVAGISNSTNYLKIGDPTSTTGNANLNIFDNLDYGIHLTASRCDVKNTTFQNMLGMQPVAFCFPTPCIYDPLGVGIFAPTQTEYNYNFLLIGGNGSGYQGCSFIDCFRAAEVNNYWYIDAYNNYINCKNTPSIVNTSVPSPGSNGFYFKNTKEATGIYNNTFNNIITAVYVARNTAGGGSLNPAIIIDENYFTANDDGYCSQAVLLTDVSGNSITGAQQIYVRNNTTEEINNGIKATHIKNNAIIYDNIVGLRYNSGSTAYSGIMLEGCDKAEIKNNEIYSNQSTYGSGNWNLRGIYVKTSTNNKVYCNVLYSLGQCMTFEGTCTSATASGYGILSNSMDNARTGLMLRSSGIIGTQGNSTTPSGNTWNNSFTFSDGRTYTQSTNNANTASILYCTAGGSTFPPLGTNYRNGAPGTEYFTGFGGGLITATGSTISCPTEELPEEYLLNANGAKSFKSMNDEYAQQLVQLLMYGNEQNYLQFNAQQYLIQQFIYKELNEDAALLNDSTLNAFYSANQSSSIGLLFSIDTAMGSGNYSEALAFHQNVTTANTVEENQLQFNDLYLNKKDTAIAYTQSDVEALYAIANQCALQGGNAVYQSRNLLMAIENRVIDFIENCDEINNQNNDRSANSIKQLPSTVRLYPNPNNGSMTLEYSLKENETGMFNLYNITGTLICSHPLQKNNPKLFINNDELEAGIYLYDVSINNKKIKTDKMVIIK
ncbi:MAG: T9SS type A sorting domain-containing protein, partial [Bacteroidia bacterium]|nr:T9SS type A sorting domain-containing protein [Bacteroidia bacterium]